MGQHVNNDDVKALVGAAVFSSMDLFSFLRYGHLKMQISNTKILPLYNASTEQNSFEMVFDEFQLFLPLM